MDDDAAVVLDTTVISNFASSSSVCWLARLIERPMVVPAVYDEVLGGIEASHQYLRTAAEAIGEQIELVELEDHSPFHREQLDVGERESLIVAIETSSVLATDDLAARTIARSHDVPVTGSVGLLVRGIDRELIDIETADRWLGIWREQRG